MKYMVFGLIIAAITVLVCVWLHTVYHAVKQSGARNRHKGEGGYGKLIAIVGAGLVALVLVFTFAPFTVVSTGHVGVVTIYSKVEPEPLREGFHFVPFVADIEQMNIRTQKDEFVYDAASKDLQHVGITMVLNYRLKPESAPEIYKTVGRDYLKTLILPAAAEVLKSQIALHISSELLQERPKIKSEIQRLLAVVCEKYGVELQEVSLADIRFSQQYQTAIEAKQLEEQRAQQKLYELKQAELQAQIKVAEAKGAADSLRLTADAEAEYNRKIAESLTAQLIQKMYFEKWDGRLPQMQLSNQTGVMLPLPDLRK